MLESGHKSICVFSVSSSWITYFSMCGLFFFRTMLGHSGHTCISAIWQSVLSSWDTVVGIFFVTEATYHSHQVMSFLGKITICTNGHAQLHWLCHVIQGDMLSLYCSWAHLFLSFHLFSSASSAWETCLSCGKVQFLFDFLFMIRLSLQMLCPITGPFIFRFLWKVHIALQELQAVELMLSKMTFWLPGKLVALHLDISTAKAYLYSYGGRTSLFSFQAILLHFLFG